MSLRILTTILLVALVDCAATTIDHDKVEPFPQPVPVTISEKAAIKFKPQLITPDIVCLPYPAVNAAGDVTGGLKGTNGNDACEDAPLGSQVYGRARWYKDLWAIMYAWYFPKGVFMDFPTRRHDWKSVVVWINNPDVEAPQIIGVSMSKSDTKFFKEVNMQPEYFAGSQSSSTTLRFKYHIDLLAPSSLYFSKLDGNSQDLIMWEQLTDAAREALNNGNSFGEAEVQFSDEHFETFLKSAWPFKN